MSGGSGGDIRNHMFVTVIDGVNPPFGPLAVVTTPNDITAGSRVLGVAAGMMGLNPNNSNLTIIKALLAGSLIDGLSAADLANGLPAHGYTYLFDTIGGTFSNRAVQLSSSVDALAKVADGLAGVANRAQVYNGATFDRERAATRFVSVSASAAGNTTVFDPGAGNNYRLLAYMLEVTGNAALAAAGNVTITLGTNIVHQVFLPAASASLQGVSYSTGFVSLGKLGFAGAADANLVVNLSAALTTGNVRVNAQLVEEVP